MWTAISLLLLTALSATGVLLAAGGPFRLKKWLSGTASNTDGSRIPEDQRPQVTASDPMPVRAADGSDGIDSAASGNPVETASASVRLRSSGEEGKSGDDSSSGSTTLNGNAEAGGGEVSAIRNAVTSGAQAISNVLNEAPGDSEAAISANRAGQGQDSNVSREDGRKEGSEASNWRVDTEEARRVRGI